METERIVKLIVMLTIGIIIVGSLLAPVVNNVSKEKVYQTGYAYRATETLGDYTYTCDAENLYLNGKSIDYAEQETDIYTIGVASENVALSWREQTTMWSNAVGVGVDKSATELAINADGSWTLSDAGNTYTSTDESAITSGIFANNEGELAVYYAKNQPSTLTVPEGKALTIFCNHGELKDSDNVSYALAFRATVVGSEVTLDYAVMYDGTTVTDVSDSITITLYGTNSTENGLTTYNMFTYTVSVENYTSYTRNLIATDYLAYEKDGEYATIYYAIPIMMITAMVVAAATFVWSRK